MPDEFDNDVVDAQTHPSDDHDSTVAEAEAAESRPASGVITTVDPEDATPDKIDLPPAPVTEGEAVIREDVSVQIAADFEVPVVASDGSVTHEVPNELFVSIPGLDPEASYVEDSANGPRINLSPGSSVIVPANIAEDLVASSIVEVTE